ncbi:MAG: hypothetical protein WC783_04940 [Candidatus Paceibacterota bacterium]|jgi:ribulose-phosphate 3-epimerase
MSEIIPAILPKHYEDLKNKISLVRNFVPVVQIDICDGVFVPSRTWPYESSSTDPYFNRILNEEEGLPFWEDIDFELDLMVVDAVENFDLYNKLGAKRLIFHIEAIKDLESFRDFLEGIDPYMREVVEIGVAINPSTALEKLYTLVPQIDFIQCMGNDKLGFHGVELEEKVYDRIKVLRKKYFDLPIAVDIGVNRETAPLLIDAGADKLVIGSAIFNSSDIIGAIDDFRQL